MYPLIGIAITYLIFRYYNYGNEEEEEPSLSLMTYNINSHKLDERFERIKRQILRNNPDVLMLQGLNDDSVEKFKQFLVSYGYNIINAKYKSDYKSGDSLHLINAVTSYKLNILKSKLYHCDVDLDLNLNLNLNSIDKNQSYLFSYIEQKYADENVNNDKNKNFIVANTRFELNNNDNDNDNDLKKSFSKFLNSFIKLIGCDKDISVVLAGNSNFNSNFNSNSSSNINSFVKENNLNHLSQDAVYSNGAIDGKSASISVSLPQTLYQHDDLNINDIGLNYVLGKNVKVTSSKILVQTLLDNGNEIDIRYIDDEEYMKTFMKKLTNKQILPFPSNHFPLVVEIRI